MASMIGDGYELLADVGCGLLHEALAEGEVDGIEGTHLTVECPWLDVEHFFAEWQQPVVDGDVCLGWVGVVVMAGFVVEIVGVVVDGIVVVDGHG